MQLALDLGAQAELALMRGCLRERFGPFHRVERLDPINQLVKSLLGSRTRDEISWRAYERLIAEYPKWSDAAAASATDVEAVIADVTFADVKARRLGLTLNAIAEEKPCFNLTHLGRLNVTAALAWLEKLPGVGRKVSAATLNFSVLALPAFVIDTHILRVLRRYGLVRRKATIEAAYNTVMQAVPDWGAEDFAELHFLLKRLGQTLCRADHADCGQCPIRQRCRAVGQFDRSMSAPWTSRLEPAMH